MRRVIAYLYLEPSNAAGGSIPRNQMYAVARIDGQRRGTWRASSGSAIGGYPWNGCRSAFFTVQCGDEIFMAITKSLHLPQCPPPAVDPCGLIPVREPQKAGAARCSAFEPSILHGAHDGSEFVGIIRVPEASVSNSAGAERSCISTPMQRIPNVVLIPPSPSCGADSGR